MVVSVRECGSLFSSLFRVVGGTLNCEVPSGTGADIVGLSAHLGRELLDEPDL